jgi:AraC-like DNA-binding protein
VVLTTTPLHQDDSLRVFDVRCSCSAGEHDEEMTVGVEVVLPVAGAFIRRASGGTSFVDAASGYVARPHATHEITHLTDGDRCIALEPSLPLVEELGLDRRNDSWVVHVDRRCQQRVAGALAAATSEDQLVCGEAWLDVVSALGLTPPPVLRPGRTAQHGAAVSRVREAIAADPGAAWTMRALGSVGGYAPHHLSRVFHASTGMTLSDYRERIRLGRAMAMLRDGMPVADVASTLGYFDHAHLARRAFRALGVRPSAFRSSRRAPMSKRSR